MTINVRSNWENRPKSRPEKGGGVSLVETAGYIPAKQKIESMINAGRRLAQNRANNFHIQPGESDEGHEPDPTMAPGYDLADASNQLNAVRERLKKPSTINKKAKPDELVSDPLKVEPESKNAPSGGVPADKGLA